MSRNDCSTLSGILYSGATPPWPAVDTCCGWRGGFVFRGIDLRRIDCDNSLRIVNISMYDMKLNNSLPDLQELPQLRHIELGSNNFDSFTDVFAGLASRLVYLSFHSNPNIRGTFPQSVARMVNLRDILMNGNRITGPIPDLRSLTQITTCNLGPLSTCLPFSNKAEYIASQPLPCRSSLDALVICADAQVFNPNEQPSETLETSESTATTDPTSSTTGPLETIGPSGTTTPSASASSSALASTSGTGRPSLSSSPTSTSDIGSLNSSTTTALSTGALAGIIAGVLIVILAIVGAVLFLYMRRNRSSVEKPGFPVPDSTTTNPSQSPSVFLNSTNTASMAQTSPSSPYNDGSPYVSPASVQPVLMPPPRRVLPAGNVAQSSMSWNELQASVPVAAVSLKEKSGLFGDQKNYEMWTTEEVAEWLIRNEVSNTVVKRFQEHAITGRALTSLTEAHLENSMHIQTLGDRLAVYSLIQSLRLDRQSPSSPEVNYGHKDGYKPEGTSMNPNGESMVSLGMTGPVPTPRNDTLRGAAPPPYI